MFQIWVATWLPHAVHDNNCASLHPHAGLLPTAAMLAAPLLRQKTHPSPLRGQRGARGRCTRENCKYLHPPAHLKTQLEINGRNNLIQQKTAAAMLAQQMQFMIPGTGMQPVPSFPVTQGLGSSPALSYAPYLTPMTHGVGLVPTEMLPSAPVIVPSSPPVSVQGSSSTQKLLRTDKLESRCSRDKCKYFHPPAHLQAKIKAAQHQANQTAVAAQAAAAAMTQSTAKAMKRPLETTVDLRPALEKSNGTSALFSPSMLHYQQALANTQLQQPAAFFPTDHPEVTVSTGTVCQDAALRSPKQPFCKYYLPPSLELQQSAC
ncbi:hypothetical protein JZ751_004454 [Albula glossodonta]|uniref:Muscleblind-like CCCH zinc finger domain-containing protein n=1 Tax=Albula glossodonta TaxID=121402 RepID=A0A8T2N9Z2_9TELE|nr:hypothetical protein JZ751_004454 [Albula glossodonta]